MDSSSTQQERARAGLIRALSDAISALKRLETTMHAADQEGVQPTIYRLRSAIRSANRVRIDLERILEEVSQFSRLF